MNQLALDFERPAHKGPIVPLTEVDRLIAKLRGRGWQTAEQLGATNESERRMIRAIAEESDRQIISGQRGYKLTVEATYEEMEQTVWVKNQGKKMVKRWAGQWRLWHRAHPEAQ